jgi:hypothetical protein
MTENLRDGWLPPGFNLFIPSSGLLRGVSWFKTDVSGLHIDLIFKCQTVSTLRMGSIGGPETSVLNQLTQHSNPEDNNSAENLFIA